MKVIGILLFIFSVLVRADPISPSTPIYTAASNMYIQRGWNTAGQDVVFSYWETSGLWDSVKHCSITTVSEFLDVISQKKTVLLATISKTPTGFLWEWQASKSPPTNINPWCLQ